MSAATPAALAFQGQTYSYSHLSLPSTHHNEPLLLSSFIVVSLTPQSNQTFTTSGHTINPKSDIVMVNI